MDTSKNGCDGYVRWNSRLRLWGTYQTSHCSVMEAYQVECEPEEVDRNHPMTIRQRNVYSYVLLSFYNFLYLFLFIYI